MGVHNVITGNRLLALLCALALLGGGAFVAQKLRYKEDVGQLLPKDKNTTPTTDLLQGLNATDRLTFIVSQKDSGTAEEMAAYAAALTDSLQTVCAPFVRDIRARTGDSDLKQVYEFVYRHLPLFLDDADYEILARRVRTDSINRICREHFKSLLSPTAVVSKGFILRDPLGITFLALNKLRRVEMGGNFTTKGGYLVTMDEKNLLLFVNPTYPSNETAKNTEFVNMLARITGHLDAQFKGHIGCSYFGGAVVAVGNASQIKTDIQHTSIFAALGLLLVLALFYRNLGIPLLIFVPSIFGALAGMSVLYFMKGTVSAISLGISSILLGETTDYSIYVLTYLRNKGDVKRLYRDITKPLLLCGITTSVTFLCLVFVKTEALKDLGIFAAVSVTASAIFSLMVIPAIYRQKAGRKPRANPADNLGAYAWHNNKGIVTALAVLVFACLFVYKKVGFNSDLASMNYMTGNVANAGRLLDSLNNATDSKTLYLAVADTDLKGAARRNAALAGTLFKMRLDHRIASYVSAAPLLPSDSLQNARIKKWYRFWGEPRKSDVIGDLIMGGQAAGFKESAFISFCATLDKKFNTVPFEELERVKTFSLSEFISHKSGRYTIITPVTVPEFKLAGFFDAIKSYPDVVVIDRKQTNETFLSSLKDNFLRLINYSLVAIFILLLLAFGSLELAVITILPILASWVLTTGLMVFTGLQFNVLNIIVCTLVFGIGVDYSIFTTLALQKEHTYGTRELPTYRTSILLSVCTTVLGIGVLIFAKHPALKSIAGIALVGIFAAALISFVLQPLLFGFCITGRTRKGTPPLRLRTFIHSMLSFLYYGAGGIVTSFVGVGLVSLLPGGEPGKMRTYRAAISAFMKSVLYSNPFVRKRVLGLQANSFDRPAILIANHTSFLDILAIGMLSPKIIFVVNDWVYKSPIFGRAVQKAGFYPVRDGYEGAVEHLRAKVAAGYSVIIFPEGTRSTTNRVARFHKGAFFLAEQLQVDILPVIIHGNSEVLPKGDFIIHDGSISVALLDRITPGDKAFGIGYAERTKKIGTHFKQAFRDFRLQHEGPTYFHKVIRHSYDYMDADVRREVRARLARNAHLHHDLNRQLSEYGDILLVADDYGEAGIALALHSAYRHITGHYPDLLKRQVAANNYLSRKHNLRFPESLEASLDRKYDFAVIATPLLDTDLENVLAGAYTVVIAGVPALIKACMERGWVKTAEVGMVIVMGK